MTVAIPEAGSAVATRVSERRVQRKVVQGRVQSSRTATPARRQPARANTRTIPGTGGPEARSTAAASAAGAAAGSSFSAPGRPRTPDGMPSGGGGAQHAILLEFLIAAGVVAFLPLATGGPPEKDTPSPYQVTDLVQLLALGLVYFLLAAMSGGAHGKVAAWFGGLVLLGLVYRKFATGELNVALTSIHPASPTEQRGTLE